MVDPDGCIVRNVTTGHFNVSALDPNPVFVLVTLITYLKWKSVCVIYNDETGYNTMTLVDQLYKRDIFVIMYHVSEVTSSKIDALASSKLKNHPDKIKFILFCNIQYSNWCGAFIEKPFDYDRKHVWRNSLIHFSRWIVLVNGKYNLYDFQRKPSIPFDNVAVVQTRDILQWHPFIIKSNGTEAYTGFLIDMLIEMAKSLNFTYEIQDAVDRKWGTLVDEKTNTWNGLVGELQRREVDLVVAPITTNSYREQVIDFTHPFYYEFSAILFKKQSYANSRWTTLMKIFRPEVLLCTGVALFVVSLILFALEKYSPFYNLHNRSNGLHYFSHSFWYMYGALLTQGGQHMAQALSGRTFLTSWWLFCIILAAAYSGNFVAFLTASQEILPFSNIEELVLQKDYKIGTLGATAYETTLKNSVLPERITLWNKIVEFNRTDPSVLSDSLDEQIQKVLDSDFYAFLGDKTGADLAVSTHCELTAAESDLLLLQYGLGLPNHSPFVQLFSEKIETILESGLMHKWKSQYLTTTTTKCLPSNETRKVNLFDIQLAFYLISIGIILAFILLSCENIHRKLKRYFDSRQRGRSQHIIVENDICGNETLNRNEVNNANRHQVSLVSYNPEYEMNYHSPDQ